MLLMLLTAIKNGRIFPEKPAEMNKIIVSVLRKVNLHLKEKNKIRSCLLSETICLFVF